MSGNSIRQGKLRGEKIKYQDGVGCCIWEPMKDSEDDDDFGICFDFGDEHLEDLLKLVKKLIEVKPVEFVPDPKEEKREEEQKELEKKWWYRVYDRLEDISLNLSPFEWKFRRLFTTRPISSGKGDMLAHKMCAGFCLGPLTITW